MPFCPDCDKFWNPNSMAPDGSCPTCGRMIADGPPEPDNTRVPWHFWVLVAITAGYLLWRVIQGAGWLFG